MSTWSLRKIWASLWITIGKGILMNLEFCGYVVVIVDNHHRINKIYWHHFFVKTSRLTTKHCTRPHIEWAQINFAFEKATKWTQIFGAKRKNVWQKNQVLLACVHGKRQQPNKPGLTLRIRSSLKEVMCNCAYQKMSKKESIFCELDLNVVHKVK